MKRASTAAEAEVVDVVDLCRQLIAIPSENPPGNEVGVANHAAGLLEQWGFDLHWFQAAPDRPNLVARLRSGGSGPTLILQSHGDTKPASPPGTESKWTRDPFGGEIADGRLYGLGSCDTKGGMAAQLAVACHLASSTQWAGELVVQVVADEEDGSKLGAQYLLEQGQLDGDGALVAEPTSCRPSLAQLGNAWGEIAFAGRSSHPGSPKLESDAFRAAMLYINALEQLLQTQSTNESFPGHPRLNVGEVLMPGHPGTVPGQCLLRCDIRVLPGVEREQVLELYDVAATRVQERMSVEISVDHYQGGGCQSHAIRPDHRLAQAFGRAQTETGRPIEDLPFGGGTDARFFARVGTPAIVYGPGDLAQAHAPDEYVPVSDLLLAKRQLTKLALDFLAV